MLEKAGPGRISLPLLRFLLRRLMRFSSVPKSAGTLHLDPTKPVCYALHLRQLSALLVLEQATEQLGMPSPFAALASDGASERSAFFFLTRSGQPSPLRLKPYAYSKRLARLIGAAHGNDRVQLQIVPVSIFWGRAPQKQESVMRALLADAWVVPGAFKQLLRLAIHGRNTLIKFSEPIDLQAVMRQASHDGLDEQASLRRVASLLRAEFRREREMAIGPNLSHRHTLLNEVVGSAPVSQAVAENARQRRIGVERAQRAARRIAYGIASDYSYSFIRVLNLVLNRLWERIYDGVDVHRFDDVSRAGSGAELVYVPCHRSHIDYLLLSHVIYHRGLQPPHIAAGENLNLPLIGAILRRGGAFFMRRSFKGDRLYAAVFSEYLHTMLKRGFPLEYFVEAGRSRTGRMLAPKAGLLSMTVDCVLRGMPRPLAFIPIYLGYERLFESESYVAELSGSPKRKESLRGVFASLRKLKRRFGTVHVNVGDPIDLEAYLDEAWPQWRMPGAVTDPEQAPERLRAVDDLARRIVTRINDALVVSPVNLLAVAMLGAPQRAMDAARLVEQIDLLKHLLSVVPYSRCQHVTELDGAAVIAYGERLGVVRRIAHALGDIIAVPEAEVPLMGYLRNNVLHAFALPALVACLVAQNVRIEPRRLEEIARRLYPFLRSELFLSWPEDELAPRLQGYLDTFRTTHLVHERGLWISAPAPAQRESVALHSLAHAVRQPLERYFIAVATLVRFGPGALSARLLEDCCVLLAQRLAYLHEAAGPEFFDRASFRAIIGTLSQIGVVAEAEGKLHFSPLLERSAEDADYLLSPEARLAISQLALLADDDIVRAAEASNAQR